MLSFAEEIYLLSLDDTTGKMAVAEERVVLGAALVGAVLGELSFMERIDSDKDDLILLDTSPTGNPILDCVLTPLRATGWERLPLRQALDQLQDVGGELERLARQSTIAKGIVEEKKERLFWVISTRRYPVIDNRELVDVERRLRAIVTDPELLPDPRDTVLIGLVEMCGLFEEILSPREYRRHAERIRQLARLDLVSQKVRQNVAAYYEALAARGYIG